MNRFKDSGFGMNARLFVTASLASLTLLAPGRAHAAPDLDILASAGLGDDLGGRPVALGLAGEGLVLASERGGQGTLVRLVMDFEYCEAGLSCAATVSGNPPSAVYACEGAVAAGAACKLAVPDQCPAGQFCDVNPAMQTFTSTCKPLPTDGEPCTNFQNQCAARHECGNENPRPRCHAVNRIGGECVTDSHCSSEHCSGGACIAVMQCDPDA